MAQQDLSTCHHPLPITSRKIILFLAFFHLRPGWCAAQVKPCSVLFSLDFLSLSPLFFAPHRESEFNATLVAMCILVIHSKFHASPR